MSEEIVENQMQTEIATEPILESEGDSSESATATPEKQSNASEKQQGTLPVKKGRPLLNRLEGIIEKGYREFWQVGEALWEIREKQLYVERYSGSDYASFSDYLQGRWGYRSRGYQLMEASQIRRLMIDGLGIKNPDAICPSERQYRENAGLLRLATAGRLEELKDSLPERKSLTVDVLAEKVQEMLPSPKSKSKPSSAPSVKSLGRKLQKLKMKFEKELAKLRSLYPDRGEEIGEWLKTIAEPSESV